MCASDLSLRLLIDSHIPVALTLPPAWLPQTVQDDYDDISSGLTIESQISTLLQNIPGTPDISATRIILLHEHFKLLGI